MSDKLRKFTNLLQSIFELDKSDLDFGIYRIVNICRTEIEKFLNIDLATKVQEILTPFASKTNDIQARIEVSKSKMAEEYTSLNSQLIAGVDISALVMCILYSIVSLTATTMKATLSPNVVIRKLFTPFPMKAKK